MHSCHGVFSRGSCFDTAEQERIYFVVITPKGFGMLDAAVI